MRRGCRPLRWTVSLPCYTPCIHRTPRLSSSATPRASCWRWRHAVPTTTERCLNSHSHSASSRSVSDVNEYLYRFSEYMYRF